MAATSAKAQSPRTGPNTSRAPTTMTSATANGTAPAPFAPTLTTYRPASSGTSRTRSQADHAGGAPGPATRSSSGTASAAATPASPNSIGTNHPSSPSTSFE